MTLAFCVCVPARNEADRIGTLIAALAEQTVAGAVPLALCVNNSEDGTADVARAAAEATGGRVMLEIVEHRFEPPYAHVGSARRAAMELGIAMLGDEDGLLIATDADCRPPADWIAANCAHTDADLIVGGRIELDDPETLPPMLLDLRNRFDRYWRDVRAIEDAIDPSSCDPPPRHGDHTGASLALSVSLYRRAGGVPLLETGEDRALVEHAIAAGGRLVHPPAVWTRASARTSGRAPGGMAGDMARWLNGAPPKVPAFDHWRARAEWRRKCRADGRVATPAEAERSLAPMPCDMLLPEL